MLVPVVEAKYISGYKIWGKFDTGDEGEVDLTDVLWGEVFEPLKDREICRRFTVEPEAGTLVGANGADLAPESLFRRAQASLPADHLRPV
jgi:hypothetical protein